MGRSDNSELHTDGQLHRSPHTQDEILAFDVSVVEPNSTSHANSSACNRSFLNVNSGTRVAEKTKSDSHKALCTQHGMTFAPVIFEHHKWGYGRTVPEAAVAPTLEESRGE